MSPKFENSKILHHLLLNYLTLDAKANKRLQTGVYLDLFVAGAKQVTPLFVNF
jgi:hypothetical protein